MTGDESKVELPTEPTDRIVAAIIPRGERAWVFRLTGPVDPVGKEVGLFKQLVRSTRFETDGSPKWTLPEGWTEEPQTGLRFATIKIPSAGGPPLDFSVSVLPGSNEAEFDSYLLANVNRWRGQLQLPPLPPLRLHDTVEELKGETVTASMVDLSGRRAPTDGMGGGPMGPMRRPGAMPAPNAPTAHDPGAASPAATDPATKGAAPVSPMPTGPSPSGPAPTGPAPTGAAPTGPAPTGPAPTGPAPAPK